MTRSNLKRHTGTLAFFGKQLVYFIKLIFGLVMKFSRCAVGINTIDTGRNHYLHFLRQSFKINGIILVDW